MKSLLNIPLVVALLFIAWGCEKEVTEVESTNFVKIVNDSISYASRNAIELADGSVVIACVGVENPQDQDNYGNADGLLLKYAQDGSLIWKKTLPESVYELWQCLALSNGNILILGYEKDLSPERVGALMYSPEGNLITEFSFVNQTRSTGLSYSSVYGIELRNGNIALVMPSILTINGATFPRLVVLSGSLNVLFDRVYSADNLLTDNAMRQLSLVESADQSLTILGKSFPWNAEENLHFAFSLGLEAATYEPYYFEEFAAEIESEKARFTSNIAEYTDQIYIWCTSGGNSAKDSDNKIFNFRDLDEYYVGPEIEIWQSGPNTPAQSILSITAFPKNAYISAIKPSSDGGFVLVGTCNINNNQQVASNYRVIMVKLNASLQVEWIQTPDFGTPTVGTSIKEINTGYLGSATHLSFDNIKKPLLFKINKNGNFN